MSSKSIKLSKIITSLETLAPRAYAESFDNVGLLIGDNRQMISKALVTLDCTEDVIDEAISTSADLVITFHPIIFKGLKRITGQNYVERVVLKAIKHDIAIYAIHTNLDFAWQGSNKMLATRLGLNNLKILLPKENTIKKLTTYVPKQSAEQVRKALFKAGAGNIGNYNRCSFNYEGMGSFCGNQDSQPVIGNKGEIHLEEEICINVTFEWHKQNQIIAALKSSHPYEEVAYEIYKLDNINQHIGIGIHGKLEAPMSAQEFLAFIKKTLPTDCIRHSEINDKPIKKVAVLGGAGSFALHAAKSAGVDAFVSGDFKYHEFFMAENQLLICDIGHYESEQFIPEYLKNIINKDFPELEIKQSSVKTNPIYYYK